MGLRSIFAQRDKPTPMGAAAPELHSIAAGVAAGSPPMYGDELPDVVNYSPREARSWRGRLEFGAPSTPATDTADAQLRIAHTGQGSPDPRAVWGSASPAGLNFTAPHGVEQRAFDPAAHVVAVNPQGAPVRNRAGSTGEDTARPSTFAAALFQRPFDQFAEYGPSSIDKLPMISPIASVPIQDTAGIAGALPSASGTTARAMEAIGVRVNTFRTIPSAWDEQLVDNGGAAAQVSSARSRGWRA